jgi:hypothetical protein
MIVIRTVAEGLLDKQMARHPAHSGKHEGVSEATLHQLFLDHVFPGLRVR